MGKLITIVGVSGAGKTTLLRALNTNDQFAIGLEEHARRPFQSLFKDDHRFALANQLDYLLFRADQERALRADPRPALVDGGLELDFYGFTRLFHAHGWLSDTEFDLCRRFFDLTRRLLPPPDLIVHLTASAETIQTRLASRNRINIASAQDAKLLNSFLEEWLKSVPLDRIVELDVSTEKPDYPNSRAVILKRLAALTPK